MPPRLMLDEMSPPSLAEMLRDQGHDVLAVAGSPDLAGSPDEAVLDAAVRDARCLVTENVRDFAILARHTSHYGILFINADRCPPPPAAIKPPADALAQLQ